MKKNCFHCDLPIITGNKYFVSINNEIKLMCCPGCKAVFQFIIDSGFIDYYNYRDSPGNTIKNDFLINHTNLKVFDNFKFNNRFLGNKKNLKTVIVAIDGISCAACTWLIERHFNNLNYINMITVNLSTCKAKIVWDIKRFSLSLLLNEFRKIGYNAYPYSLKKQEQINKIEYTNGMKKLIIAGIGMAQLMMLSVALYIGEGKDMEQSYCIFIKWISFIISTPVLFFSGKGIFLNAFRNIKNYTLGMDFTVSLSLFLGYAFSVLNLITGYGDIYFDSSCMFVFFLLISRFLEMRARHHALDIISSLQDLNYGVFRLLIKNGNSVIEKPVKKEDIHINDYISVNPGEIIPVDGIVISGSSNVDESMLTGEFTPISKCKTNKVIGGSTNIEQSLVIKVTHVAENSRIAFIIKLLEKSNLSKPNLYPFINIVAKYFVLSVIILTSITCFIWIYLGHENILNILLSMLIIACPCALSLSVPVAITASINSLSKLGLMVVKSNVINDLCYVTDIIFDKTGTLTINKFFIDKFFINRNISIKKIFSLTMGMENVSKHPIAKAFTLNKFNKYILLKNQTHVYINNGIEGIINNNIYKIGKLTFTHCLLKDKCKTFKIIKCYDLWVFLSDKYGIIAGFKLTSPLRQSVYNSILNIKSLNIIPHILSGDPSNNVNHIAQKLNIKYSKNNYSVKDKVNYIKTLQQQKKIVMMIGDGINDVPALSAANISMAMGSGADLAKINSDSILLNNDLSNIYKTIKHTKKTRKLINQNIIWAIFYNIIGLSLAALGYITPYYAALGMSCSSLIVVLNSLRLGIINNE